MKYNLLIFSFLILIMSCTSTIADNNYIINNDTVYIDDFNVYLSATPHTLSCSEWVYFNLTSKVYTGNIDACWGFNTTVAKPIKAELYKPHWVNTTTSHQKTFFNPSFIIYTGDVLDYGNSYNTNYRYTITEQINNDNGTIYMTSNAAFDSFNTDGTNYTVYWGTRHDAHYLWKDFTSSFNSVIYDYNNYDKWYYIKNVPVNTGINYTVRAWIDVPISTEKQFGKYYFAIKPSHETISQAITNGHFYNLDPWWNATWSNQKNITLTGNTSGAQTNYQLLLNITYEDNMQNDYDDLRFCNETHKLDSWLELKVNGFYTLVWVEFPTTPANTVEQTYYMYYGNRRAASDWDIGATFVFGDDFSSNTIADYTERYYASWNPFAYKEITGGELHIGFNTSVYGSAMLFHTASSLTNAGYAMRSRFRATGYQSDVEAFRHQKEIGLTTDTTPTYIAVCSCDPDFAGWHSDGCIDMPDNHCQTTAISGTMTDEKIYSLDGSTYYPGFWVQDIGTEAGSELWVDWAFIRKYVSCPPTYAFGSEEYYIPPTTIVDETKLIMSEITTGLKSINMGNYLVYAFILIGILLIILGIQIITNNIYRG